MHLIDVLGLCIPASFVLLVGLEWLFPAKVNPPVRGWRLIGLAMFFGMMLVGVGLPLAIPANIAAYHLLPGERLGVVGGIVVGYLLQSLLSALYHRACHASPFLWRWSHQLHHSAARFDMAGAVLFHPVEMVAYTLVSVLAQVFVLGLDPLAAAAVGTIATFYSLFQHCNIRTPAFLGYFIQRPESHALHHQIGVHNYNFSDLPLWDLLAGTFRNPAGYHGEAVGFGKPVSYAAMFLGRDVSGGGAAGIPIATPAQADDAAVAAK
jgi:sterol desaturase/sphingolipid hydroxylase (fatty acid hydroxylase superfamily)